MTIVVTEKEIFHLVYSYSDCGSEDSLQEAIRTNSFSNGVSDHGYRTKRIDNDYSYYYQLEDVRNQKAGKYQIQILHKGIEKLFIYSESLFSINNGVIDVTLHNTRNIHNSVLERLKNCLQYDSMVRSENKIDFIEELIKNNYRSISREIFSSLKSLEQIAFDYDTIDFINSNRKLNEQDFSKHKIHTLVLLAFYIYENDFLEKDIHFQIDENNHSLLVNFNTFRSALALLLENSVKYSKPGSIIHVDYSEIGNQFYIIDIEMESIYNSNEDIEKIFLPNHRGANARKLMPEKGVGLGLYVAKTLLKLNDIHLDFKVLSRHSNNVYKGIEYSRNMYVLKIPRSRISTH